MQLREQGARLAKRAKRVRELIRGRSVKIFCHLLDVRARIGEIVKPLAHAKPLSAAREQCELAICKLGESLDRGDGANRNPMVPSSDL